MYLNALAYAYRRRPLRWPRSRIREVVFAPDNKLPMESSVLGVCCAASSVVRRLTESLRRPFLGLEQNTGWLVRRRARGEGRFARQESKGGGCNDAHPDRKADDRPHSQEIPIDGEKGRERSREFGRGSEVRGARIWWERDMRGGDKRTAF